MAVENITTTAGLSEQLRTYYSMRLLPPLLAYIPLFQDAQRVSIPKNSGKTVQFRAWAELALATSALTEGDPPSAQTLDLTEVTATLAEYGGYVKISAFANDVWIDQGFTTAEPILARQGGRSLHKLLVDVVAAGTNVQYVNNAANRAAVAATDTLTVAEIEEAVALLENRNVERFPDGYFHGLIHPKVANDLKRDPEYRELYLGGGGEGSTALRRNMLEPVGGVKFHMPSTDAPSFSSTTTVYRTMVYGPNAFGAVDLAGRDGLGRIDANSQRGLTVHIIRPETDSKSDPLHQYGTVGWIARFVAKILQQERIQGIESGAST
jgi:N4-gp56 family major capsid protein